MINYDFVEGDIGPEIDVTLTGLDLTGASVSLVLEKPNGTTITRAMSIGAPASGNVSYVFAAGELVAGVSKYEVRASLPGGVVVKTRSWGIMTVRPALA
jgi:hypothetical protein